jgi:SAM-dependent methyltransferase
VAAGAYEHVSAEYERGRPTYAPDAVGHVIAALDLGEGSVVLDLGAGTGKLTRMLAGAGLAVTALDPSLAMLAQLGSAVPEVRTMVGTAESIPLPEGSIDGVTAAQAFHWFDSAAALREMHRVLRPSGGIALVWNRRDESDPMQRLLAQLTDPPERTTPRGWQLDVPALIDASGLFGDVSTAEFRHAETTDKAGLISRLRSSSYIAGLPAERRVALERQLEHGLEPFGPAIEIAYTTIVYAARRRP